MDYTASTKGYRRQNEGHLAWRALILGGSGRDLFGWGFDLDAGFATILIDCVGHSLKDLDSIEVETRSMHLTSCFRPYPTLAAVYRLPAALEMVCASLAVSTSLRSSANASVFCA